MDKPYTTPLPPGLRLGTAVLAEDLADGTRRQRSQELTWIPGPQPTTPADDEPTDPDAP